MTTVTGRIVYKGGKGSGNFGHGGRPGKVGGSAGGGILLTLRDADGRLSDDKIIAKIATDSLTGVDIASIGRQVRDASKFGLWGKTSIDVADLIIQDIDAITAKLSTNSVLVDSTKPIIVDSAGFVIDGRHRAALAIMRSDETITGYVPITGK